jgi:hypothetical protein
VLRQSIDGQHRWTGTSIDIAEFKTRHIYARYNTFDNTERYPVSIKWLSNDEFVILGGEGDGARFRITQELSNNELKATGKSAP